MITFENTEIAFKSKTDKDLIRAYWLFKIIGYPRVVKFGKWFTEIALKLNLPIDGIIKKTIFKQFCGGTNIEDCSSKIKELVKTGKADVGAQRKLGFPRRQIRGKRLQTRDMDANLWKCIA